MDILGYSYIDSYVANYITSSYSYVNTYLCNNIKWENFIDMIQNNDWLSWHIDIL